MLQGRHSSVASDYWSASLGRRRSFGIGKDPRLEGGVREGSEREEELSWAFGASTFFPSAHAPERSVETSVRDFGFYQETICNSMCYLICRQERGAGVTIPEEERIPFWRR